MTQRHVAGEFSGWVTAEMAVAADYAYHTGYFGAPDEYPALVEARARHKARVLLGGPGPDPQVLMERETEILRRRAVIREQSSGRIAWTAAVDALSTGFSGHSFARTAFTVAMLCAVIGLIHGDTGWRGWAVLALGASLIILNLRLAPALLRFVLGLAMASFAMLRDLVETWVLGRQCARLRALCRAEQDNRSRIDQMVGEGVAILLAEYRHHKNLAMVAATS